MHNERYDPFSTNRLKLSVSRDCRTCDRASVRMQLPTHNSKGSVLWCPRCDGGIPHRVTSLMIEQRWRWINRAGGVGNDT